MDLNALQLKINNYITVVSSWVRNVGKLYFSATPENVTVDMIDDDGNLTTSTLPNVAQFRKRVWDDVGGALGKFYSIFYVDSINGNDSNDGSSANPFKTIKKAVSSTPSGGYGRIYITKSQTHTIDSSVSIQNRIIEIKAYGTDEETKPIISFVRYINEQFPDNTVVNKFSIEQGSQLKLKGVVLRIPDPFTDKPYNSSMFGGQSILFNGGENLYLENVDTDISNATGVSIATVSRYEDQPHINIVWGNYVLGDNYLINNRFAIPLTYYSGADSFTANTDGVLQQVRHISRDADSGNPINIISNLNFSS